MVKVSNGLLLDVSPKAVCLLLIQLFVNGDVVCRVFFHSPIADTLEIVKVAVFGISFMQIPHVLWTSRHIRSDLVPCHRSGFYRSHGGILDGCHGAVRQLLSVVVRRLVSEKQIIC